MNLEADYQVEFQEDSFLSNFTAIPNIIFDVYKLDPYELKAYCIFKRTAGDRGRCFKSIKTLCEEVGCQKPKLIEIKKSLEKKGLIKIIKRKKTDGGNLPDLVHIINIWPECMKFYSDQQAKKAELREKGGGNPELGGGVIYDYQGGNLRLPKEDHIQEKQKASSNSECSRASTQIAAASSNLLKSLAPPLPDKPPEIHKPPASPKVYDCLAAIDIEIAVKVRLTSTFNQQTVRDAVKWATRPDFKPSKGLAQAICWACSTGPQRLLAEVSEKDTEKQKKSAKDHPPVSCFSFNTQYWAQIKAGLKKCFSSDILSTLSLMDCSTFVEYEQQKISLDDIGFLDKIEIFFRKKCLDCPDLYKFIGFCKNNLQSSI